MIATTKTIQKLLPLLAVLILGIAPHVTLAEQVKPAAGQPQVPRFAPASGSIPGQGQPRVVTNEPNKSTSEVQAPGKPS